MGSLRGTTRAIIGLFTGNGSSSGSGTGSGSGTPSGTPPLPNLGPQIPLQRYLDQSYQKAKATGKLGTDLGLKTSVPISIFLRSSGTRHIYAGNSDTIGGVLHHLDEEEYFSASLVKMAAMFAAFKLRAEARALIADMQAGTVPTSATQPDFFNKLSPRFNLANAVPKISGASGIQKQPSLDKILTVTGFPNASALAANFVFDFQSHMRKMIIPSDNCSAGECIWRLSYPYINVKLMEDGYFDKNTMKGIWLCGDYIQTCDPPIQAHKQTYIMIDTINDCNQATPPFCGSAQDTTSKQMARLVLNILLGTCVDVGSSNEMRTLMEEGQQGSDKLSPPVTVPPTWPAPPPHPSYLTRPALVSIPLLFDVDAVKVGFGPIKPDPQRSKNIRSEGIIIKWKDLTPFNDFNSKQNFDLTGEAAICWQNIDEAIKTDGVVEIINTSIPNFLGQVALTP